MMNLTDILNTVHCADCLDIMRDMPDKCVDLVLTDPPYGLNIAYKGYNDTQENLTALISKVFPEILRISKLTVTFCGIQNIWIYPRADWVMSYSWDNTQSLGFYGFNQWQPILIYGKEKIEGHPFKKINGELRSDTFKFSQSSKFMYEETKDIIKHPCPKPITIINRLLYRFSKPKQTILDPFAGSGTTAIACLETGRNYILIEKEPDYVEIINKRIATWKEQGRMFA